MPVKFINARRLVLAQLYKFAQAGENMIEVRKVLQQLLPGFSDLSQGWVLKACRELANEGLLEGNINNGTYTDGGNEFEITTGGIEVFEAWLEDTKCNSASEYIKFVGTIS